MGCRVPTLAATSIACAALVIPLGGMTPVAVANEPAAAFAQAARSQKRLDVPFVPTPPEVVAKMLELAEIREGDVLYDLGCGDGRIVIAAAKTYGIRAVGIDIDPERVAEARANVRNAGVANLVTIKQGDLFREDFREADIVTMYLLPNVNERLKPQLRRLKEGSRIVSHSFTMKGATPERVVRVEVDGGVRHIFLWTVPWDEEN